MAVRRRGAYGRFAAGCAAALFAVAAITGCDVNRVDAAPSKERAEAPKERPAAPKDRPKLKKKRTPTQPNAVVPAALKKFRSVREAPRIASPRRLRIPKLRVNTSLEQLGLQGDETIEVPRDWQKAGWYRDGPRPGDAGSAVILGHVDSPQGSAVFTGLARLKRGTRIHVDQADGSTVTFRVTRIEEHLQAQFPTDLVYLPTLEPELRLITCGGRYIKARGGYQSNVIVFARADSPT